jgi:hypothetical protein
MKCTSNYLGRSVTSETGIQRVVDELEGVGDCHSRRRLEAFADIVADLERCAWVGRIDLRDVSTHA